MGPPCLGSFFEVFCIRVAEAQSFGFNETLWLMATGRATVPNLYAGCLSKPNCNFVFVARVGLCCGFCDFAVSFLVPPDGPKNGTVRVLFFCSLLRCACGPCLGSFFEVFCIRVAEAQSFGFNETLWLMATGRATVPNLYAGCLSKPNCNFVFVARVGLCCGFCDFAVSFLVPPDGPKNGTVRVLFFCSLLRCACGPKNGTARRSHFWDRV